MSLADFYILLFCHVLLGYCAVDDGVTFHLVTLITFFFFKRSQYDKTCLYQFWPTSCFVTCTFERKPMKWQECVGAEEAPDDVLRESDDPLLLPRAPLAPGH